MQVSSITEPRLLRVRLALIRTLRWDLPEGLCFTLPEAVKRNRFFVPLWVFILFPIGILKYSDANILG